MIQGSKGVSSLADTTFTACDRIYTTCYKSIVVSLGLPVAAQAKVDGHEFEVEVHAENENADLSDGRSITTENGYGLGANAANGYVATIDGENHDYAFKEMVWSGSEDEGYEVVAGHFVCSRVLYHEK